MIEFLVLACIVFIGAVVQGALGFGIGLLSVPFFLILEPSYVPAVPLLISLPIIVLSLLRDLRYVEVRTFLWLSVGRVPGTVIGSGLLSLLPEIGVRLLAVCVLSAVTVLTIVLRRRSTRPTAHAHAGRFAVGSLSGFMGTTSGVGGPVLALSFHNAEPRTMRGTINATTLFGALLSLGGILLAGRLGAAQAEAGGVFLAPALIGLGLSGAISRKLRKNHMGTVITVSVLTCCVLVIVQLGIELYQLHQ